jgi:hypothetical protein
MYISTNISRQEMFIRITIRDQDAVIGKILAKRKIEGNAV